MRQLRIGLLILLGTCLASSSLRADYLAGVTYFGNQLIRIDPTTGDGVLVGGLGANVSSFGLAQRNNSLYTFDSNADVIRQLNPLTGATLATISIGIGPVLGQGGLAFRNDGIGFLTSALNPSTFALENNLYQFNIATGTSSLVGHMSSTLAGIAFVGGTLYGIGKNDDTLYTVNQTTAALTRIGFLTAAAGSPFQSLSAGPNGQLYATFDDRLFSINAATGLATAINPDPSSDAGFSSISGLTYISTSATVPEPATVILLGIALPAGLLIQRYSRRSSRSA